MGIIRQLRTLGTLEMPRIGEIVKQFLVHVDGVRPPINARIEKHVSNDGKETYEWWMSHRFGDYYPGNHSANSVEEAEQSMRIYVGSTGSQAPQKIDYY